MTLGAGGANVTDASPRHLAGPRRVPSGLLVTAGIALVLASSVLASPAASASARGALPGAPRSVRAVAGDGSAAVSFRAPASSAASPVVRYVVRVQSTGRTDSCRSERCTVRGLTNGTPYSFAVAAVNRVGRGPFSGASNTVTPQAPVGTSYAVTFDANGGTGTMEPEEGGAGTTVALSLNEFAYAGYTFVGWNTAANGSGTGYADGANYPLSASVTLYAQWSTDAVSVTFDPNGGSGTMPTQSGDGGSVATLTPNRFTYSGHAFAGWNTAPDGSGSWYADGADFTFASDSTLYAYWEVAPSSGLTPGWLSLNWSGYVLTDSSGGYQEVGADWVEPTLNCTATPAGRTSDWVGVNGWNGLPGLFQTGTDSECDNGTQVTYASWTDESLGFIWQEQFTVSAGDLIHGEVYQDSLGSWHYEIQDLTSGVQAGSIEPYGGLGSSAEWIAEDTGDPATGGFYPLADFSPVTFTNLSLTVPSGSWSAPPYSDAIEMESYSGAIETVPTAVVGAGTAAEFSVYFKASG